MTTLHQKPWWTPADDAQLGLLVYQLVKAARIHRERCGVCSAGRSWCPALRDAFDAVIEWRTGRILRSKAAWLRAEQELREWEVRLGRAA